MAYRSSIKLHSWSRLARYLVSLTLLRYSLGQAQPHTRGLLTGFSNGNQVMQRHAILSDSPSIAQPSLQNGQHFMESRLQRYSEDNDYQDTGGMDGLNRKLLQSAAPAPSPVSFVQHGQQGQPSATQVYTIINNNDGVFGSYVCVDACAHGNTCIWQNAWLWQCNGTNPTHHYWVWEPDTNIIRSATTDTFEAYPEICLDMCTDSRYGNGACAITATTNTLNVGYAECTGLSNQQWTLQGTQIVNKQNNYCLSAGPQSCGRWSNCNKSLVQTRQNNTILNVYAEPCNPSNVAQQWSLGPAPNSTLIDFTPLNVSAAKYPAPVNSLAAQAYSNSHQVVNFVDDDSQLCLSIENQASCQSRQANSSSTIINPLSTVCVWQNAFLQTCWSGGSDAAGDQGWIYDNSTGILALATNTTQNVCLEMCTDDNFARGSCSLVDDNIGWQSCDGSAAQKWEFVDGTLYNMAMDMCVGLQPFCMVDYNVFNADPSAINKTVQGYSLASCITDVKNNPWASLPWNSTNGAPLGIQNLIATPCNSNATLQFSTRTAGLVTSSDPIAPGSPSALKPASAKTETSTGAIVGGILGGVIGLFLIAVVIVSIFVRRSRAKRAASEAQQFEEYQKKGMLPSGLYSIDSDTYVKPKGGWLAKLDLTDDISPSDIEICKTEDGEDWKLGEGAFGTVYKANRFGCQPVAVKVLREESGKQIENFQREIEILRGLRDNNIVLFLGVCQTDNSLMLVTEYMPQGDLWHALNHGQHHKFSWYQRGRKIALDVARGLVHLHSRDIVHMDLKSPNILLGKDLTAKIADVGLARSVTNSSLTYMTSIGTMAWAAPELKRNFRIGRREGPRTVTPKVDVFSFGVVLWEIVTGEDPTKSNRDVVVPAECPPDIEALIKDCLVEEPDQRPDMKIVYDALKKAASIPPPGASHPLPTPLPTPPISQDGSIRSPPMSNLLAPRSQSAAPTSAHKSAPKSGNTNRLGLAAALRKKLANGPLSRSPQSSMAPLSNGRVERILEDQQEGMDCDKDVGQPDSQ